MRSWTDITVYLDNMTYLYTCKHDDNVSLCWPGWSNSKIPGMSIHFTPAQLPILRQMIALLESLPIHTIDEASASASASASALSAEADAEKDW